MKKHEFKIGERFYTGTGLWVCTDVSDTEIRAKLVSTHLKKAGAILSAFGEVSFNNRHWPSCRQENEHKQNDGTTKRTPCFRCYNDDRSIPFTILGLGVEYITDTPIRRGTVTVVCLRCQRPEDVSSLRFGKYKWICLCGANIWQDDPKTDYRCISCGRKRAFWTPVEHT